MMGSFHYKKVYRIDKDIFNFRLGDIINLSIKILIEIQNDIKNELLFGFAHFA